jgi:hypothetical protein
MMSRTIRNVEDRTGFVLNLARGSVAVRQRPVAEIAAVPTIVDYKFLGDEIERLKNNAKLQNSFNGSIVETARSETKCISMLLQIAAITTATLALTTVTLWFLLKRIEALENKS